MTNGSVIDMIVDDQVTLQVMLDKVDVVALKSNLTLIATDTNTVIELPPQALADNQCHMLTPHTTNPILTSFTLNL